jgi:hypothetical protein
MPTLLTTPSTYRYRRGTAGPDPVSRQKVQATLARHQFAVSLAATRVRRAHAELHTLLAEALCSGVQPRVLAQPAEIPVATIRRIALLCEDETFSGRPAEAYVHAIIDKKREITREIRAKSAAEKQQALFVAYALRNKLIDPDAWLSKLKPL